MSNYYYNPPLLKAIGKSGFRLDELAALAGMPEGNLYRILTGKIEPDPEIMRRLSILLDAEQETLFPVDKKLRYQ